MKSLAIALVMTFIGFGSAQAGCANLHTQLEMNKCAAGEFKVSDRRMNSVYRRAMSAQNRDHKKALRKAQRSWLTFRDNACKSYSFLGDGGSIRPLLYSTCLSKLTSERTKMLQLQTIGFGG